MEILNLSPLSRCINILLL